MANRSLFMSFVLVALVALLADAQGADVKSERDLRQDLFLSYDKKVRPVRRASTPVPVAVSVAPLTLRSMDEKEQVIVLETWMMMKWSDEYLRWNPGDYDNITQLRLSPSDIWKPDVSLYTGTPDTSLFPVVETNAVVYSSGIVLWVPPFTMKSRCPLPFRNYVTNRSFVECNIRIGSWTYGGPMVDLQLSTDEVDLTNFEDFNPEWKLVKVVTNRQTRHYKCCPEEYPHINFNVTLKRRNYYLPLELIKT